MYMNCVVPEERITHLPDKKKSSNKLKNSIPMPGRIEKEQFTIRVQGGGHLLYGCNLLQMQLFSRFARGG